MSCRQRRWRSGALLVLAAVCGCARPAPHASHALQLQDQVASDTEALQAVHDVATRWKRTGTAEWSADDRRELDAALDDVKRTVVASRRRSTGDGAVRVSTGSRGALPVVEEATDEVDQRAYYRQQGRRYELLVHATRAWLAAEGEDVSAERRHQLEAGLRAARTSVFQLPTLEKQLRRQPS